MGRYIVFEKTGDVRVPRDDEYADIDGEVMRGSEVFPKQRTVLRRLTDEEVDALVTAKSSAELHSLAIQKALEELGPVNQSVSPRNDAPPSITYLTQEQLAKMDCPYPPEPGYEDEKPADDERGRFVRETAGRMFEAARVTYPGSRSAWRQQRDAIAEECHEDAESLAAKVFGA